MLEWCFRNLSYTWVSIMSFCHLLLRHLYHRDACIRCLTITDTTVTTMPCVATVIFEGHIFCGWQLENKFHNFLGFICIFTIECILIMGKFNFYRQGSDCEICETYVLWKLPHNYTVLYLWVFYFIQARVTWLTSAGTADQHTLYEQLWEVEVKIHAFQQSLEMISKPTYLEFDILFSYIL